MKSCVPLVEKGALSDVLYFLLLDGDVPLRLWDVLRFLTRGVDETCPEVDVCFGLEDCLELEGARELETDLELEAFLELGGDLELALELCDGSLDEL